MRRLACSLVAVVSCRTPEPSPPIVDATAVAADRGPTAPAKTPAPTPPVLEAIRPVAVPWPAAAIYVDHVEDVAGVALFPDERAAIRTEVARWLQARGESVIPLAELEAIENAATRGELALEGNRKCRAPLHANEVRKRWFATHRHATIAAACYDGDCSLDVTVHGPGDEMHFFDSTQVRRPEDPKAWLASVRTLRASDDATIGLGLFGMGGPPPPIMFGPPEGIGPWAKSLERSHIDEKEAAAAPCAHPDPAIEVRWEIRAAVGRSGRVTRCDASTASFHGREADAKCLCEVVGTIAFPRGAAGRRLRFPATDDGQAARGRFVLVQPGTEPWIDRLEASPILRRCSAIAMHFRVTGFPLELTLADDGQIADVNLGGDVTSLDRMRFATCVVDELKATPLPCAPPGIATLHAELRIGEN